MAIDLIPITPEDRADLLKVAMKIRADIQFRDPDRLAGGFFEFGLILFDELAPSNLKPKFFALLEELSAHLSPANWDKYARGYPVPASPVEEGLAHLVLDSLEVPRALIEAPEFVPFLPGRFQR